MSDLPPIVVDVTPQPDIVVDVTPLPDITVDVGALYGPPSPRYGTAPQEVVATEFSPGSGIWIAETPGINGATYTIPDFSPGDTTYTLFFVVPADLTTPGAFRVFIEPQTGTGTAQPALSDGGSLVPVSVVGSGGSLDNADWSDGGCYDFANDGDGWVGKKSYDSYLNASDDFEFVTAVADLRSHMYVGKAHDGGGVTDYIDQARTGDDPGFYMATDNAALLEPNGTAFPASGAAMIALRNQAAGAGEGKTGFYHACRMPVGLTFTITTPLGDITVTPANYASPQPVAGDVCLVNGLTVDGQWQNSNIQAGEDVAVDYTNTWRTTGEGMFTDFEDITPGTAGGDVVGPASSTNNNIAVFDGTTGKLLKDGAAAVASLVPTSRTVSAGTGITGGGDLSANRSFAIDTAVVPTLTGSPIRTRTTSDSTISSDNTLSDDPAAAMSFAIGASEVWYVDWTVSYSSNTTPDFQVAVTGPAGATCNLYVYGSAVTDNTIPHPWRLLASYQALATATPCGGQGNTVYSAVRITGVIVNSTTAGNITLQWAQNTSDGTNTIRRAGSTLKRELLA